MSKETSQEDHVVITGLERPLSVSDFDQSNENEHISTILVKPHRDAVQKLSIEYARLVRENQRLRSVIASAVNILENNIVEKDVNSGMVHFCPMFLSSIKGQCKSNEV